VLEDQHPEHDDHRRAEAAAAAALRPAAAERGIDAVDDRLIVEDGVDLAQFVVPEVGAVRATGPR
jgi:hypothetical protein